MNIKINSDDLFQIKFKNNYSNIKFQKELIKDSYSLSRIDNTFITFISLDKNSYIVYSTEDNSINCFDFSKEKK